MIPVTESMAVSRMNGRDTGKKTVINGVSNKTTAAAFTLELDPEYPDYLSTVYVAFGPPRHTVYLPVPFAAMDKLPANLLNQQTVEAAIKRRNEAAEDAAVDPELVKLQNKVVVDFAKTRNKARQMLRSDRCKDAEKILRETMDAQAAEIAEFLKK